MPETKTCDNCGQVYTTLARACPWCSPLETPLEFPAGFCRKCGTRAETLNGYCVKCNPYAAVLLDDNEPEPAPASPFTLVVAAIPEEIREPILRDLEGIKISEPAALEVIRFRLARRGQYIRCGCRHDAIETHDIERNPAGVCQEMTCFCLGLHRLELAEIPRPRSRSLLERLRWWWATGGRGTPRK